ncbi:MAG: PhoH family protein [Planctomycetaceae bacterium]|nr:PhoH family protein [Planctomycetaceae bacterium]
MLTDKVIPLGGQTQVQLLVGTRDQNLRRVCDQLGISAVIRDGELRLRGEQAAVQRGEKIFTGLQSIIERTGRLRDEDVTGLLLKSGVAASPLVAVPEGSGSAHAAVDLFEKARQIHPRTDGQAAYVRAIRENEMVFCGGPAGCGKTYLAVATAINALRRELVRKIVLVRPAVEAGEKLGFLPGDLFAKVNPYLRPLLDALNDMLDYDQVRRYLESDVIEIVPLAFMRGRTLNGTFIILDEGQNTTITQMKMFLTRMGSDSRIVVTGDTTQLDLPDDVPSGMTDAMQRLSGIPGVAVVRLTGDDIVRHPLVREVVRAYEEKPAEKQTRP